MNHPIRLYDTTLRDGNQSSAVSFSVGDKLRIAEKLDEIGIHYVEGGWPNPTDPADRRFFREVRSLKLKSSIAAFGATRKPGKAVARDEFVRALLHAQTRTVTIFGKSWDLHVRDVLRTTLDENLRAIESTVAYLKKHDREVIYDAEHYFDGCIHNAEYARKTLCAALAGGADSIVLCDTNGGMLPMDILRMFQEARCNFPEASFGIHAHNDTGNAVANTLLAVHLGANQVQGTINGIGERCGNANLCTVIANLALKMKIDCLPQEQLRKLTSVSLFVSEIANMLPDARQPFVGENAFAHKGGAHIDGVLKNTRSFEHIEPAKVGNGRRYVLSNQAGRSAIVEKIRKISPHLGKKDPAVRRLLRKIKAMEEQGYQFEAAEGSFQVLAKRELGLFKEPFKFRAFRVIVENRENGRMYSEATIQVQRGKELEHTAAEGDGPIDALNQAIRKALVKFYPQLKEVQLGDFKVRIMDGREGTQAVVRVLIESHDHTEHWGTVGVSTNIIEASWLALIDSLHYKLMKET